MRPVPAGGAAEQGMHQLTSRQAQIVDLLKQLCPGFAEMRKLVLGFLVFALWCVRASRHPASLDGAGTKEHEGLNLITPNDGHAKGIRFH
jgi:hypothetical protein